MFWSVDLEVTSYRQRVGLIRARTDELIGRGLQPELADLRVSRTAARVASDPDDGAACLEDISGLFDLHGEPVSAARIAVGDQLAVSQDAQIVLRVTRLEREHPTLMAQRLGEAPVVLHGPAWQIDLARRPWHAPRAADLPIAHGLVREGPTWMAAQDGARRPLVPGDEVRFGGERLFFLAPRGDPSALRTVIGGPRAIVFERCRAEQWIRVRSREDVVDLTGAPYHALSALLDTPEYQPSVQVAKRAQAGWGLTNLNSALYQVRNLLRPILDLDDFHKVSGAQRRFRLTHPGQLVELGGPVTACPTCGQPRPG